MLCQYQEIHRSESPAKLATIGLLYCLSFGSKINVPFVAQIRQTHAVDRAKRHANIARLFVTRTKLGVYSIFIVIAPALRCANYGQFLQKWRRTGQIR